MTSAKLTNSTVGNKIYLSISVLLIFALIFGTPFSKSFAEENSSVDWQLLYIKQSACGPNDNVAKVYASLTSKYLELYQLDNHNISTKCITESQYRELQQPSNATLTILVFDNALGKSVLQPNTLDGVYVHSGNDRTTNHLLMMCDCLDYSSGYETTLPSWILSHELSHFVLSYKGFSKYDIRNKIHEKQDEYDNCIGTNFGDNKCNEYKIKLRADSSTKDYVMMAPYEPAIGNTMINYISTTPDSELVSLQRDLTKMWVTNTIDDNIYQSALKHLVNPTTNSTSEDIHLALEFPNGFMIRELSKPTEVNWQQVLNQKVDSESTFDYVLNYVPFNLKESHNEINIEKMPNWFKTRALLWSEKRISDKVFFEGVEHLVRMGILKVD